MVLHDTTHFDSEFVAAETVENIRHSQQQSYSGFSHPDDHIPPTYEMTLG